MKGVKRRLRPLRATYLLQMHEQRQIVRRQRQLKAFSEADSTLEDRLNELDFNTFNKKLIVHALFPLAPDQRSPWLSRLRARADGGPLGDYQPGFENVSMKREQRDLKAEIKQAAEQLTKGQRSMPQSAQSKQQNAPKSAAGVKRDSKQEES